MWEKRGRVHSKIMTGTSQTGRYPDETQTPGEGSGVITADSDCSHEIKRREKAMTNLDSVLKSRDITLLTKVHIVKAMTFPLVTYKL